MLTDQGKLNNQNKNESFSNDNVEFNKLRDSLITYGFTVEFINSIQYHFSFEMNSNKISAQTLIDEYEANLMNDPNVDTTNLIMKCLETCVNKTKGKNRPNQNSGNRNQRNQDEIIINNLTQEDENKELKFEVQTSFNERNFTNPYQYNTKDISYTFYSNLEIKEYTFIPKDDEVNFEEYSEYFRNYRQQFLESLGINNDDPLMDMDKFFLVVTFGNYYGKPVLNDIELIDPLKNYTKYSLKIENENVLRDFYFFSGQMIYIEGHLKNKEIFAQKIVFGINPISYNLSEPYVRGFYQDPNPYSIVAVNGPILNKNNCNLEIFLKTLINIANDNPHALIINGPFINSDNTMVISGDIRISNDENSLNYFEFFENILNKIDKIFNDKRTTIILTPSLSDMTNYYPLPQPAFNFSYMNKINNLENIKKGKLKLIGNPQIFQLNETILGVANFDVVKDMLSNSIRSQNKIPTDSTLEMILQQRSFYPILPNSINLDDSDKMDKIIQVNVRKLKDLHFGIVPDIIISPTWSIAPFVKKISSTLFINPGYLIKNNQPGHYVKITQYSPTNSTGVDILNRVKVEIMKISFK